MYFVAIITEGIASYRKMILSQYHIEEKKAKKSKRKSTRKSVESFKIEEDKHELKTKNKEDEPVVKYCSRCFKTNSMKKGFDFARENTDLINTFCSLCPNQPHMCTKCFDEVHSPATIVIN